MTVLIEPDKGDVIDEEHATRNCFLLYYRSPHRQGRDRHSTATVTGTGPGGEKSESISKLSLSIAAVKINALC